VNDDDGATPDENIQALHDAANDLPSDDPLRATANAAPAAQSASSGNSNPGSQSGAPASQSAQSPGQQAQPASHRPANTVVIASPNQLRVPSLIGLSVRQAIVEAGNAGLEVEISGSGTAREQAPTPGAMVPPGTKIVVKCAR